MRNQRQVVSLPYHPGLDLDADDAAIQMDDDNAVEEAILKERARIAALPLDNKLTKEEYEVWHEERRAREDREIAWAYTAGKKFKMNTKEKYVTPNIYRKSSQYKSVSFIHRENGLASRDTDWHYRVTIQVVWFNRSGWFYVTELEGRILDPKYTLDHGERGATWRNGKDLRFAAFAAEARATALCAKYGAIVTKFAPYIHPERY